MVQWRVHPARENPQKAGTVLGILAIFTAIFWALAGPWWALAPFPVGILATWSFWVPTTYTLTEEGIEVRRPLYKRLYPWRRFRRYSLEPDGVFLGTFSKPSALDPFRGLFLLKAPPKAVEMIKSKIKAL